MWKDINVYLHNMIPSPPLLFKLVAVVAVEPLFLIGVLDIEKGSVLFEYEKNNTIF